MTQIWSIHPLLFESTDISGPITDGRGTTADKAMPT